MVLTDNDDSSRNLNKNKLTEDFTEEIINKMLSSRQQLKEHVLKNAQQGDVQNIVDTIDKFCWTQQWMMNIGDRKGLILDQALEKHKPKTILELGKDSFHFINDLY